MLRHCFPSTAFFMIRSYCRATGWVAVRELAPICPSRWNQSSCRFFNTILSNCTSLAIGANFVYTILKHWQCDSAETQDVRLMSPGHPIGPTPYKSENRRPRFWLWLIQGTLNIVRRFWTGRPPGAEEEMRERTIACKAETAEKQ